MIVNFFFLSLSNHCSEVGNNNESKIPIKEYVLFLKGLFDLAKLPNHACCTASHDFVSVAHIKMTVKNGFSGTS